MTVTTKLNISGQSKVTGIDDWQIREQLSMRRLTLAFWRRASLLFRVNASWQKALDVARNVVRGAYEQLMEAGKLRSVKVAKDGQLVVAAARRKQASSSRSIG